MSCIGLVSDGLNYLIDWFGLGCWLKWNGLDGSPLPFFGSNPLAETMDSPERSKLRLSPSADCSSSPPFWSPPLPTPSAVASAALAASAGACQATKPPSPPPHSSTHSPCPTPLHRAVHQPLPPQGRPWRISQCGSWSASGGGTGSSTNVVVVVIGGQLACPDLPLFN